MKTINYFKMLMVVVAVFVVSLVATTDIKAQTTYKPYFGNVDWQFNAPFGNDFTNRASGWGANLEGGLFEQQRLVWVCLCHIVQTIRAFQWKHYTQLQHQRLQLSNRDRYFKSHLVLMCDTVFMKGAVYAILMWD
jgi:hypothetical protein